ncbi:g1807 [Coccomyxa elongata]
MTDELVAKATPAVAPGTNETNSGMRANGNAVAAPAAGMPGTHNGDMQRISCAAVMQPAEQVQRSPRFQSGESARVAAATGKQGRLTQYFQNRRQARTLVAGDNLLNQSVPSSCAKDSPAKFIGMQAADVGQTKKIPQVKAAAKRTTPPVHQGIRTRSMAAKLTSPKDTQTEAAQQRTGRNRTGTTRAPRNADEADSPVPGPWRRKHSTAPNHGTGIGEDADEGPRKTFSRTRNSSKQRLRMLTPKQQSHAASMAEGGGSAPSQKLAADDAIGSEDGHIATDGSRAPDKVPSLGERPLQLTLPRRTPDALPPPSPSLHHGHPLATNTEEDAEYAAVVKDASPSREHFTPAVRKPPADSVSGAKQQQPPEKPSCGTSKRQREQVTKPVAASLDPFAALFARAADGNGGFSEDVEPPAIDEQEIKREVKRRMLIQRMRRGPT